MILVPLKILLVYGLWSLNSKSLSPTKQVGSTLNSQSQLSQKVLGLFLLIPLINNRSITCEIMASRKLCANPLLNAEGTYQYFNSEGKAISFPELPAFIYKEATYTLAHKDFAYSLFWILKNKEQKHENLMKKTPDGQCPSGNLEVILKEKVHLEVLKFLWSEYLKMQNPLEQPDPTSLVYVNRLFQNGIIELARNFYITNIEAANYKKAPYQANVALLTLASALAETCVKDYLEATKFKTKLDDYILKAKQKAKDGGFKGMEYRNSLWDDFKIYIHRDLVPKESSLARKVFTRNQKKIYLFIKGIEVRYYSSFDRVEGPLPLHKWYGLPYFFNSFWYGQTYEKCKNQNLETLPIYLNMVKDSPLIQESINTGNLNPFKE